MWKAESRSELCRILSYRGALHGMVSLPDTSSITQMIKGKLNENLLEKIGLRVTHAKITSQTNVLEEPTSGGNVLYNIEELTLNIEDPEKLLNHPALNTLKITSPLKNTQLQASGQFRLFYSDSTLSSYKGEGVTSTLCKTGHKRDPSEPANFYVACLEMKLTEIKPDSYLVTGLSYIPGLTSKVTSKVEEIASGIIDQHMPYCIACDKNADEYKSFKDVEIEKIPTWKGVVYDNIDDALRKQSSVTNRLRKATRKISLTGDMISWITGNKSYFEFPLYQDTLLQEKLNPKTGRHNILVQQTEREKMGLLFNVSAAEFKRVYDSIERNIKLINNSPH